MSGTDRRGLRIGILLTLASIIAAMRWHTFAEPREHDLDLYAWMGHYLFQGRQLYADILEIKPPLLYVIYGCAERIAGFGSAQFYLLGVASAVATLAGLYWFGARALDRPWLGIAAAVFWVLLGSDLYLEANQPNTEVFVNAFCVWAVALLWELPDDRRRVSRCAGIGLLFAAATLCKTVAFAPAGVVIGAKLLLARATSRQLVLRQMLLVIAAIGLAWVATFAGLAAQGSLGSAIQVLFVYPREYAALDGGNAVSNIAHAFVWTHLVPDFGAPQAWLVLFCAAALIAKLRSRDGRLAAYLLSWMIGTLVAIAAPGHFYPHYYQLWLPWLCMTLAIVVGWIPQPLPSMRIRALVVALFTACWIGWRLWPQYELDATQWSIRKYGSEFVDAQALGRKLRDRLQPAQTLFVFGFSPGIYSEAGREPYNGTMNIWFALPSYGLSLSTRLNPRVLHQLQQSPPDVIVLDGETWALAGPGEPIREWIAAHYHLIENRNGYGLAARNEGNVGP